MRSNCIISSAAVASLLLSQAVYAYDFSPVDICKAAIAVEMGRDPKIMRKKSAGEESEISYVRKEDGSKFSYRCKLDGDRVVWKTYFPEEKKWGRWRDGSGVYNEDAVITYSTKDGVLKINSTHANPKEFKEADFKE